MPRIPRIKSETGLYHIMIRGNERKNIFHDSEDKEKFLETLFYKKQEAMFLLPAFCLMDNHVHLILGEGLEDIAKVMKRITVSYVYYFNKKYKRVGHLFQDRFKSEAVENDLYLLSLTRYIHQNPIKAGMVKTAGAYKWSSYNSFINEKGYFNHLLDTEIVLKLFSEEPLKAKKLFRDYMNKESEEVHLDIAIKEVMDEEEARCLFLDLLHKKKVKEINSPNEIPANVLKDILLQFKTVTGLSVRRIAAITGLNKNRISRLIKDNSTMMENKKE